MFLCLKRYMQRHVFRCITFIFLASSATALGGDCRGAVQFYEQYLPYLQLSLNELNFPKADDEVTADFLVQTRIRASNDNKDFKMAMAKAIKKIILKINAKLGKEKITVKDIKEWFNEMAKERAELAIKNEQQGAEDYVETTFTQDDKATSYDIVINKESHAHFYVFSRLSQFYLKTYPDKVRSTKRLVAIYFNGKHYYVPLTSFILRNRDYYLVSHKTDPNYINLAYAIFADILNNHKFYEKNLDMLNLRLSQAVFILMHHTPWVRGTPSTVESVVEAILRAAFGLTHPSKKVSENFWDAMIGKALGTASVPSKGKVWGFFLVFKEKEEDEPEPKPEAFEYGNGWQR